MADTLNASRAYHWIISIFAPVVYQTFFTTIKGEQTLSHFLEKLLITKAIYQLLIK